MTANGGDGLAHFDTPDIVRRNTATKDVLALFVPDLVGRLGLRTAVDVGTGFGYFSRYARELGLQVEGLDVRPENVEEARRRHPDIAFGVADIEDATLIQRGPYDVVLCLGVLHHLENPLKALRNLTAMTAHLLIVEAMATPFPREVLTLYDEVEAQHQGVRYLGLIPSKSWLVKSLYRVGFPFVLQPRAVPAHPHYRATLLRHPRRTLIVAAKTPIAHQHLTALPDSPLSSQLFWLRRGLMLAAAVRNSRRRRTTGGREPS
jgi:2-polyprenyl-3-methyl-5-hydroxy-6-metoxy-1,4-benzoquinol methylase